jgi:hypothetical protein
LKSEGKAGGIILNDFLIILSSAFFCNFCDASKKVSEEAASSSFDRLLLKWLLLSTCLPFLPDFCNPFD